MCEIGVSVKQTTGGSIIVWSGLCIKFKICVLILFHMLSYCFRVYYSILRLKYCFLLKFEGFADIPCTISAITESSRKVLSLSFSETPQTPVVGNCMPPFLSAKDFGGNDLHPQFLSCARPLQSLNLLWPLLPGPLHLRGKAWASQNKGVLCTAKKSFFCRYTTPPFKTNH